MLRAVHGLVVAMWCCNLVLGSCEHMGHNTWAAVWQAARDLAASDAIQSHVCCTGGWGVLCKRRLCTRLHSPLQCLAVGQHFKDSPQDFSCFVGFCRSPGPNLVLQHTPTYGFACVAALAAILADY